MEPSEGQAAVEGERDQQLVSCPAGAVRHLGESPCLKITSSIAIHFGSGPVTSAPVADTY